MTFYGIIQFFHICCKLFSINERSCFSNIYIIKVRRKDKLCGKYYNSLILTKLIKFKINYLCKHATNIINVSVYYDCFLYLH